MMPKLPLLATLVLVAPALADPPTPKLSDVDLQILAQLHHGDMLEVKTGKLALQKATTQAVRGFGKMLVDEHGADARAVLALVANDGKTLPPVQPLDAGAKLDEKQTADAIAKLASLDGAKFDVEFLRGQVAMHDKTLARLHRDIARAADNPDLARMLRDVSAVVVKHRQHAQTLLGALK